MFSETCSSGASPPGFAEDRPRPGTPSSFPGHKEKISQFYQGSSHRTARVVLLLWNTGDMHPFHRSACTSGYLSTLV